MKTNSLFKILSLAIIALMITSCATEGMFTSRKYTAGNYRSFKHKAPKTEATNEVKQEPVYASTENGLTEADFKTKKTEPSNESSASNSEQKEVKKAKLKAAFVSPIKNIKVQIKNFKAAKQLKKNNSVQKNPKEKSSSGLDTTALVSMILSVLAIICDVIGFALIVSTLQYVFLLLFAVALALGITGLIMGTKGLKNHRENNGSVLDLVFSIVGTALGGISIILALYYCIWSVFWIALNA
jgi:uncharacterized membrane protein